MALQFKRGTNTLRQTIVLEAGEPFYVTDAVTYGVSPLWVGDGVTFGGKAADINNLDELLDVTVISPANNQLLQWDSADGRWENRSSIVIPNTLTVSGTTQLNGNVSMANNIRLQGTMATSDYWFIRGGGINGAGFLEIATSDEANEQIYVRQYTGSNPDTATINKEITLMDASGNTRVNRLGVNKTPTMTIDAYDASTPQLRLENAERAFILTNNANDDLLSFSYDNANRLQFNSSNQWFNTGGLGVNTGINPPAATLDINGFAKLAILSSPPASPVDGMIAIANGTTWNPTGSGVQTVVARLNGVWKALS